MMSVKINAMQCCHDASNTSLTEINIDIALMLKFDVKRFLREQLRFELYLLRDLTLTDSGTSAFRFLP